MEKSMVNQNKIYQGFTFFKKRGWAMIAQERIALGCFAYLLGVATLGRVAGEIRVNGGA